MTAIAAQLTIRHPGCMGKGIQLFPGNQSCLGAAGLLCIQRRPISPHDACYRRTDDIATDLQFKCTQNRIIEKGAALYDDMLAQTVSVRRANHLIHDIFHNAVRQSRRNIFNPCAFPLSLLDGRVHKNSAPRAKIDGMLSQKPQLCKLSRSVAHGTGIGFDKGAAA